MNYEEFVETIEKDAEQYAKSCVQMNMTMQWKQLQQIISKVQ